MRSSRHDPIVDSAALSADFSPKPFSIVCVCAGTPPDASVALAVCRAGGVGILDFSFSIGAEEKQLAEAHLHSLLARKSAHATCGIRLSARQVVEWEQLWAPLGENRIWILLSDWQSTAGLATSLPANASVFLEVTSPDHLRDADSIDFAFTGWCGRGSESTGSTNSVSAYIMAQALARQDKPFLLMDIAGSEAVAACRMGGASGVALKESTFLPVRPASAKQLSRSVARALHRLRQATEEILELADPGTFRPDSALARTNGTHFPIVQGPMTRVSDCPAFAQAVAEGGALPMIALALHRGAVCEQLLAETKDRLAQLSWGVGLLGFAPPDLLEEQMDCVLRTKPRFAVLSGGRPDQVARLERGGTMTYLHVPAPSLIKPYFERGVRRFIFEGSECGGHTGPLTSFSLWAQSVEVLMSLPAAAMREVSVLFAGGIHDALSAAMASAFAAPLAARGAHVGVLMGTAYLFTQEIVNSGAVLSEFQTVALGCESTARVITGPGHMIRCAPTPFVEEISQFRQKLDEDCQSAKDIARKLEEMTLGRARAASRGWMRRDEGAAVQLSTADQQKLGMYMMGEVAAFRDKVLSIADLHSEVSTGGWKLAQQAAAQLQPPPAPSRGEPVAIIGMSALVPGAATLDEFWQAQFDGVNPITEVPLSRFDWRMYFDENMQARDKIYSRWGGFLDEVPFDPISFGIPPRSLHFISPLQLLALEVARRALDDAGYADARFDRENTSLSLGVSSGADLQHFYITRGTLPVCDVGNLGEAADRLPEWTEESFPGTLLNVIAGRIANRLDLGGSNRVVDAACASSLAAMQIAVADLQAHRTNIAITGGVDLDQTAHTYLAFSKTQALSPKGVARPFDRNADGIVLSEGVVMFVLKRLSDAEREGDRIYAVIRAIEGSSDGKGRSLTAPRPAGQRRALDRAFAAAAVNPAGLGLYEAHGTGTVVGDRAELETVTRFLQDSGAQPGECAIGSAKSLLGHTKAAAGAVGMMKAALALHHRVLPPLHSLRDPLDALLDHASPLAVYNQPVPWLSNSTPRCAGVSAFGFGGTNFHAVLEEYAAEEGEAGASVWPCELFLFAAENVPALQKELRDFARDVAERPRQPLRSLAFTCALTAERELAPIRLAFVARDVAQLQASLTKAIAVLAEGTTKQHLPDFHLQDKRHAASGHAVFLFPGQGSQYVGMGRELALYSPEMRHALEFGDKFSARMLSRFMLPSAAFSKDAADRQTEALMATDVAQPAIGIHSCGMLDFALRLGLKPMAVGGHSYGEFVALHGAGALSRADLMRLSLVRGEAMRDAGQCSPGAMAAVSMCADDLRQLLTFDSNLTIANFNAPRQCVISGSMEAVKEALAQVQEHGAGCKRLRVAAAFHSHAMDAAVEPLAQAIDTVTLAMPAIPVYSNFDGLPYPEDPRAIKAQLKVHLSNPVHFERQVRAMYAAGGRTFIEVGPRDVLTGLTGSILEGLPHQAVALDGTGGGLRGCLNALAMLYTLGVPWKPSELFAGRRTDSALAQQQPAAEWFVDGGRVRHHTETMGQPGIKPLVTLETAADAAAIQDIAHPGTSSSELLEAYAEYQQTMRGIVESQERVLTSLLDRVEHENVIVAPAKVEHHTQPVEVRAMPEPVLAKQSSQTPAEETPLLIGDITTLVLSVISQRTGYPPELLNLDDDVEADIGVDSIKRIDILLEIERRLAGPGADAMQPHMDRLNQFRTVRGLVALLMELLPEAPTATDQLATRPADTPSIPVERLDTLIDPTQHSCPRFLMRPHRKRLTPHRKCPPSGLYLVTEDKLGVASHVAEALRELGLEAAVLPQEELQSQAKLSTHLADLRQRYGPMRGLAHLASLSSQPNLSETQWQADVQVQLKSLLQILQQGVSDLPAIGNGACSVVAATAFGGLWARSHATTASCVAAGVHGLLRTAEQEHPGLLTSVVDFEPAMPASQIAECLIAEMFAAKRDTEAGYFGGDRWSFTPESAALVKGESATGWLPSAESVIVLTGGARGITARVAEEFARPGVHLVLIGRGEANSLSSETSTELEAISRLRERIVDEARMAGTPLKLAALELKVQQELQRRERSATLDRLRALGAEVSYLAVDVRDAEALRSCLRSLYEKFGRIDAVIHGAGVVQDAPLLRKSAASFDAVFHTKTESLLVFEQELRADSLRCLVLFSSVSGRFGNPGQADYAAANEVLSRWAWQAAGRWPGARVLSICWGPWAETGMAAHGVEHVLRERGILPIRPADGCRFLREELLCGGAGACEVIAGEGFWGKTAMPEAVLLPPGIAVAGDPQILSESQLC